MEYFVRLRIKVRRGLIIVKKVIKFLIREMNPVKKITLLNTYMETNKQIFCFHNKEVITLFNSIMALNLFLSLRYLSFCFTERSIHLKWLWFDCISLFTGLRNANFLAFLIEICSVYMFKRFYYEPHDELFAIIKTVLFNEGAWKSFFLESTYKNKLVMQWIKQQCDTFLLQLVGILTALGNVV